jgi:hypothetical protein
MRSCREPAPMFAPKPEVVEREAPIPVPVPRSNSEVIEAMSRESERGPATPERQEVPPAQRESESKEESSEEVIEELPRPILEMLAKQSAEEGVDRAYDWIGEMSSWDEPVPLRAPKPL